MLGKALRAWVELRAPRVEIRYSGVVSLNIKNERVVALAEEAAALTGQTKTGVIETALERLIEAEREETVEERIARRRAASEITLAQIRAQMRPEFFRMTRQQIDDEMYDEAGLPVW